MSHKCSSLLLSYYRITWTFKKYKRKNRDIKSETSIQLQYIFASIARRMKTFLFLEHIKFCNTFHLSFKLFINPRAYWTIYFHAITSFSSHAKRSKFMWCYICYVHGQNAAGDGTWLQLYHSHGDRTVT